ncbi:2-C-methyl-D-erythritol 4-phosphate cytidylyltransferase [bioreactor metagenome]|uniref:2-C-methyl-D-erythritol 4-phosphate cytidylyltransferase n=1 Tax=bioreactor metagenome TaxID=1076179 RepID=A0A645HIW6_9ZZZZ
MLYDKPVLAYTLLAFEKSRLVEEIILVVSEKEIFRAGNLVREFNIKKVKKILAGGETRQDSVLAGLAVIDNAFNYVAIHDGARPFITPKLIDETVKGAYEFGAAAPGIPVVDTIKRVSEDGFIGKTIKRDELVRIQTPQVFDRGVIISAHEKAKKDGLIVTDDCELVEKLGLKTKWIEGDYHNIKITTPDDLAVGEAILKLRGELYEDRTGY